MKRSRSVDTEVSDTNHDETLPDDPLLEEKIGRRSALVVVANAAMRIESVRVGQQVRLSHLAKRGEDCPLTRALLEKSMEYEHFVDTTLAKLIKSHPASPWFSRVKGTGGEAIGKVLGLIDNFGRFYEMGDPMIPTYVSRSPIERDGKKLVWVEAIERFPTPSKLRKYAGLVPGLQREIGKRLPFNADLRTMLWRLGVSLLKARGKFHEFYLKYKEYLVARCEQEGIRILPTPKGRYCVFCEAEVELKTARYCPTCNTLLSSKEEPKGVMSEGHIHMMAMRRMMQHFLDLFWVVYRQAMYLPVRAPYPIEFLGHSTIVSPWDMVDR